MMMEGKCDKTNENCKKTCGMCGKCKDKGGFQLEFVNISRVINHMTCCEFKCSPWWKIYV